ncbi:MAG: hypothetical protein HQL32_02105, partial [Planctomycetes bacterium]|nr:hypothetical protein [Planctomycetota bacterium]
MATNQKILDMNQRHPISLLCVFIAAFIALSCGGGGGGVDYLGEDTSPDTGGTTTISTRIFVDEVRSKALLDATVSLQMADGSVLVMNDENQDGVFTCQVADVEAGDAFMITATRGNLEMRNLVVASDSGATLDAGVTDEDSTSLALLSQALTSQQDGEVQDVPSMLSRISQNSELRDIVKNTQAAFEANDNRYVNLREEIAEKLNEEMDSDGGLAQVTILLDSDGNADMISGAGDDTYVPDFQVGDLTFKDVWVPNNAHAGFEMQVWGNISSEVKKYNVYVKLDLVPWNQNASDLDVSTIEFTTDTVGVGAFYIDEIAAGATHQFNETFVLPAEIQDGMYAAVFTINQYDFIAGDDNMQGEEQGGLQSLVAPATVLVGNPDRANLRLLETDLQNFSLLRLDEGTTGGNTVPPPDFAINIQVEAMAGNVDVNVPMIFELGIDLPIEGGLQETTLPEVDNLRDSSAQNILMEPSYTTENGQAKLVENTINYTTETQWFSLRYYDQIGEGDEAEKIAQDEMTYIVNSTGVSLYNEKPVGQLFELYITNEIKEALMQVDDGAILTFRVNLNHDGSYEEWTNDGAFDPTGDNVKEFNIVYMIDDWDEIVKNSNPEAGQAYEVTEQELEDLNSIPSANLEIQGLVFTARARGAEGNNISLAMIDPGIVQSTSSFALSANAITISLASNGSTIIASATSLAADFLEAPDEVK